MFLDVEIKIMNDIHVHVYTIYRQTLTDRENSEYVTLLSKSN